MMRHGRTGWAKGTSLAGIGFMLGLFMVFAVSALGGLGLRSDSGDRTLLAASVVRDAQLGRIVAGVSTLTLQVAEFSRDRKSGDADQLVATLRDLRALIPTTSEDLPGSERMEATNRLMAAVDAYAAVVNLIIQDATVSDAARADLMAKARQLTGLIQVELQNAAQIAGAIRTDAEDAASTMPALI